LDRGGTSIDVLTTLFDWFELRDGQIIVESSGMAALSCPEGLLVGDLSVATRTMWALGSRRPALFVLR
jgi:hypothetical protein